MNPRWFVTLCLAGTVSLLGSFVSGKPHVSPSGGTHVTKNPTPKSGNTHSSKQHQGVTPSHNTTGGKNAHLNSGLSHGNGLVANNVSKSALTQTFANNRALRFQAGMSPHFAQRFAAYRHFHHHYYSGAWTWGLFSLGPFGLAGQVSSVLDGQTLMVRNAAGVPQRMRLFGVAAPTAAQFSVPSQEHLAGYILGKHVLVSQMGTDADGTVVAKVFHAGAYLNEGRINKGYAWYNSDDGWDPALAQAEVRAQETSAGLWGAADPVEMWLARNQ